MKSFSYVLQFTSHSPFASLLGAIPLRFRILAGVEALAGDSYGVKKRALAHEKHGKKTMPN